MARKVHDVWKFRNPEGVEFIYAQIGAGPKHFVMTIGLPVPAAERFLREFQAGNPLDEMDARAARRAAGTEEREHFRQGLGPKAWSPRWPESWRRPDLGAARKGPKEWEPPFRGIRVWEEAASLVIVAPEWFERGDFAAWRRTSGVATWMEENIEGQDVFLVFADGELDWHANGLPKDIDRMIMRLIRDTDMAYGVVWIKAV